MQLIKRLTQTLSAGSTSLTFTDSMINDNSIIDIKGDNFEIYPIAASQTGTSVTVTFEAQTAAHSILLLINNIVSLSDPELATLLDVDLSTLSDDDILTYDETAEKWVNAGARTAEDIAYDNTDSGLTATNVQDAIDELTQPETASNVTYDNTDSGLTATDVQSAIDELSQSESDYHEYTTSEKVIGKWIDDRPIYEKVMVLQTPLSCPTNVWTYVPDSGLGSGVSPLIVDARVIDGNGTLFAYIGCNYSGGLFGILNIRTNNNINVSRLILQYTKSTD